MITRPYSKLTRLCAEASARGGTLRTFAAVATAIGVSPGRITQMFGYGRESDGTVVKPETVGLIVAAFRADGVHCEIDWFSLEFDTFKAHLATVGAIRAAPVQSSDADTTAWELRETTVLADLVELRLHPPRPGNELKDSYYVNATLLFGTAVCDYDPEDGRYPRTISIALRNARLAIGSDGYRPLHGSMIGERTESENFRRVAGGIDITGPAPEGTLNGDPIGNHHLVVIAATNASEEPFAVSVSALRGSFVVIDRDASSGAPVVHDRPDNKQVILNEFIYRHCTKDEANRAVLARATMRLRAGDAS